MCDTCGCSDHNNISMAIPGKVKNSSGNEHQETSDHHDHHHDHHHHHDRRIVHIAEDALSQNQLYAERNRGYFEAKNIQAINLVSSPGSGKTTILEKTLRSLKDKKTLFVIEGDQQTMNDAERIQDTGTLVIQINTGNGCHLDAHMIDHAVKELNVTDNSLLFIENVGNLVCPSMFDLGESKRVVIISVTEGDDKPLKYPNMFVTSDICIINKTDLLPYVDFDIVKVRENAKRINHHLHFIEMSAKTGDGMQQWLDIFLGV